MVQYSLFQTKDGGSTPTSPLRYRVVVLSQKEAVEYIKNNHYSKTCSPNPKPCYGLVWEGNLIGVLMFSIPVSENVRAQIFGEKRKNEVIELHRLHIQDNTPKNTESWFIGKCLRFLKRDFPYINAVISFADPAYGHDGTIYKATNFEFNGMTGRARFFRDKDGILRHPRQKTYKNGKRVSYNISVEDAKKRGWKPEIVEGKMRYIYKFE